MIFEVGKRFVVAPPWTNTEKQKITLSEGSSFGTGVHETTLHCIEMMENLPLKGKSVLDIGTGSGILAIVAAKLKASRVVGFDIDPEAIKECRKNLLLNNTEDIDCFVSNTPRSLKSGFDLVIANIFSDIILSMCDEITRVTLKEGFALLSGIVHEDEYLVKSALLKKGFEHIRSTYGEDYVTMLLKRV